MFINRQHKALHIKNALDFLCFCNSILTTMEINFDEQFIVSLSEIEYEGPLSVLFEMLKRSEKNIYEVSIFEIINQFTEYLKIRSTLNLDLAGDFVLIASDFHLYKSRMLLPQELSDEPDSEHLHYEIVQQMLEFQKYKIAADGLDLLQNTGDSIVDRKDVARVVFPTTSTRTDADLAWQDVRLYDLVYAFARVLFVPENDLAILSGRSNFHINDAIEMIRIKLAEAKSFPFTMLFSKGVTKRELVTFFLAILEMVKERNIILRQDTTFNEIYLFERDEQ